MDLDAQLLDRYARTRDADAFTQLVRRHAGMVFAVARRVTQDHHDAEEVAQGCFMELARRPAAIHGSLAGWLHRVATNRATDFNRINGRRRHYERAAARPEAQTPADWDNVAPLVDAALAELPEDIRLPMVLYHFQGRNQYEVAAELGVSQTTISRRLEEGVAALREKLKAAGLMVPNAALPALLNQHAMEAVPKTLMTVLGKVAVSGFAPGALGTVAGVSGGGGGGVGGATTVSGPSSVAAKGTVLLTLKVMAAVVLTAAVTTTGVALLPKHQQIIAGAIVAPSNIKATGDDAKAVFSRIEAQATQGLGDGVAILTHTYLDVDHSKPAPPEPSELRLFAQQGTGQLFFDYDVDPKNHWVDPKAKLPSGWPTPNLDETLQFADQLRTPELGVTDGHTWWHSQRQGRQSFVFESSPVVGSNRITPSVPNAPWEVWYFLKLINYRKQQVSNIELLHRPESPTLVGLHITFNRGRHEETYWLDSARNDVPAESSGQLFNSQGEKTNSFKTEFLTYAQLPDGRWYPTHWQTYWEGERSIDDQWLTFFPGTSLDAKWFSDPTARFAADTGSGRAAPAKGVTGVPNVVAATATTAYYSAWLWWPWALAVGILGAAAGLFIRQRRN